MDTARKDGETYWDCMCRACALSFDSADLKDITPSIRDMLMYCTGIEVDFTADLPTRICRTCHYSADSASQFKLQCRFADEKLQKLLKRKDGIVASTPYHNQENEIDGFKSPRTPLSEIDIPLTPLRCDPAFNQILDQKECATSNFDDNSSLTNLLNAVLDCTNQDQATGDNAKSNGAESINPDAVLSFLDHTEAKLDNYVLDDSFSLNFDSPLKNHNDDIESDSRTGILDVDTFFQHVEKKSKKGDTLETEKVEENINLNPPEYLLEFNLNKQVAQANLDDTHERVVQKSSSDAVIEECSKEKTGNKFYYADKNICQVEITDFMKFVIPEKNLKEELQTLGYVRCRFCYTAFKNIGKVSEHMIKMHPIDCAKCKESEDYVKQFMPESELLNTLSQNRLIRCKFCREGFKTIQAIYKHIRKRHLNNIRIYESRYKTIIYQCDYCNREFSSRPKLIKHIYVHRKQTKEVGIWKCEKCNKQCTNKSAYKSHMRQHQIKIERRERAILTKKPNKMCQFCGKVFSTKSNLNAHILRHNPENNLPCSICNRKFKTPVDLKHHMKLHSLNYECDMCKRKFSRSDLLAVHRRVHFDERNYKCDKCDASFIWMLSLKKHSAEHHGATTNSDVTVEVNGH